MLTKKRRNLIFFEAAILTLMIYIFALLFNMYLDELRFNEIQTRLSDSEIFFDSFSTGNHFFTFILTQDCDNARDFLIDRHEDLKQAGISLRDFGGLFSERNIGLRNNVERKFYLDQLKLYEWVIRFNSKCSLDDRKPIVPVLYFFDGLSSDFDRQAILLEQFASNQENKTMVFSFDFHFRDEPILDIIKEEFSVTFTPFVIIGDRTTRELGNNNNIISINALTVEFMRYRGELND